MDLRSLRYSEESESNILPFKSLFYSLGSPSMLLSVNSEMLLDRFSIVNVSFLPFT